MFLTWPFEKEIKCLSVLMEALWLLPSATGRGESVTAYDFWILFLMSKDMATPNITGPYSWTPTFVESKQFSFF